MSDKKEKKTDDSGNCMIFGMLIGMSIGFALGQPLFNNMAAGMASQANGPDRPATGEAVFSLLGRLELLQRLVAPPGAGGAALLPSSLPAAES